MVDVARVVKTRVRMVGALFDADSCNTSQMTILLYHEYRLKADLSRASGEYPLLLVLPTL